ncbi:AtpZ/AtpI family protein [Pedobacter sp. Du54]|uniref:AtpZ/AtpI family protein n=1 Tax=Pedobacter anseongensis TaxID=3133439 RepID=UPI0030B0818A
MTNPEKDDAGKQANNFAKYTGMAFQMLATIGLFTFIGYKIDEHQAHDKSTYAAMLGFLGVIFSLYMVVRSLTKIGNRK